MALVPADLKVLCCSAVSTYPVEQARERFFLDAGLTGGVEALLFAGILGDRSLPHESEEEELSEAAVGNWSPAEVCVPGREAGLNLRSLAFLVQVFRL